MNEPSNYLKNKLVDHLLRTTTFSQPSMIAIALCTAAPTDASTGATIVEVPNSNNYSRKTLNPSNSNWLGTHGNTTGASSGTGGSTSNSVVIEFDTASSSWGTITHVAVCDSATWGAGNVLFYGALPTPTAVEAGELAAVNVNDLTFTIGVCPGPAESYNCVSGDCVDPGDGTGAFATLEDCQANCGARFAKLALTNQYRDSEAGGPIMVASIDDVAAGSLLVVLIGTIRNPISNSDPPIIVCNTCNLGTLTFVGEIFNNPLAEEEWRLSVYYIENAPAGDYEIFVTMTEDPALALRVLNSMILEYHGIATASSFVDFTSNIGTDESPTVDAPTRSSNTDLIVTASYLGDGLTSGSIGHDVVLTSSGYVKRYPTFPTTEATVVAADYRNVASPIPAEWSYNWTGGAYGPHWISVSLSFKKA